MTLLNGCSVLVHAMRGPNWKNFLILRIYRNKIVSGNFRLEKNPSRGSGIREKIPF
jgi:hypothetical protein